MKFIRPGLTALLVASAPGFAHAQSWLEPGDRFVNRDHADDDEAFVRGKLGVVLPSYGRTSLYAAYRVLTLPSGALASESHERRAPPEKDGREAKVQWLDARAGVRRDEPRPIDYFKSYGDGLQGVFGNCGGNAFETAVETLQDLRGNKAVKASEIQEWIDGQDAVFDQCAWSADKGAAPALPAVPSAGASPLLRGLRRYQHAAALFYRGDFEAARKEFDVVAAEDHNPMRQFAALASLRCTVREASLNLDWNIAFRHAYFDLGLRDGALHDALDAPRAQLRARNQRAQQRVEERAAVFMKDPRFATVRPLLQQLVARSSEQLTPSHAVDALFDQLDHLDRNPYPEDTLHRWDWLMRAADQSVPGSPQAEAARRAHPFYDWQMTIRACDDDPRAAASGSRCDAEHAHAMTHWQAHPDSTWLLATLATARHPGEADLRAIFAARDTADSDPAWSALQYHAARVLRLLDRRADARGVIDRALARSDLDNSAANLFHQERFALAETAAAALPDALRTIAGRRGDRAVAADAGMLFDERLASDDLLQLARNTSGPAALRANLAAAAWFRADLAQRFDVAVAASALAAELAPKLAPTARRYAAATTDDDRHDVVVQGALAMQFSPKVYSDGAYQPGEPIARGHVHSADWCAFGGTREKYQQAVEHVPELTPELRDGAVQPAEFARLQAIGNGPTWFVRQALAAARRHPGESTSFALLKAVIASTKSGDELCPLDDPASVRTYAEQLLANPLSEPVMPHIPEAELRKYYDEHPNLFSRRKVYALQRVDVQVPPAQRSEVVARAERAESITQLTAWLKAKDLRFSVSSINQPAEGLPMELVDRIAALNPGQSVTLSQQSGLTALTLVSAQSAPKSFDEVRAAIEQFLTVDARRKAASEKAR